MSKYNEQYYLVFENYDNNTLYLSTHDRSDYRNYEYTKLAYGEPMFFENGYKEKDLKQGISRPIRKAHLDSTYPVVLDEVKVSLGDVENDNFQFYPSIIVDDHGEYHDNYWVFNVFKKLDVLNIQKCEIDDFDPADDVHAVDRYYLSDEKMINIPKEERLVFKPKFSDVSHIMIHESVVEVFNRHHVGTLNFVKVSDWVMGLQFVD
ncbi:hypothetical protein L4C34_18735 [Vibrio profundum]|uniref:imm11 family protein n=1 Tax=Vibrio profundum TaxID=2910247 RepID=UPI003D1307B8